MDRHTDDAIRELICRIGKLMYDRGYVVVNDGNISARAPGGGFWVTPSGVSKGRMTPDMLVKVDDQGKVLAGSRHPTSELGMHLAVYAQRAQVGAVVHAHPPLGTAFAICRRPIDRRYLPELVLGLGTVPVAPFAMPSTPAVAQSVIPFVREHNAVLLAGHGVLTWGEGLWQAFDRLEVVESAAKVTMAVEQLGGGVELTPEQTEELLSLRGQYRALARVRDGENEQTTGEGG